MNVLRRVCKDHERRHNASEPFFLHAFVNNCDGTIDFQFEVPEAFGSAKRAVEYGKGMSDEHGGGSVVYECKPVFRVERGPARAKRFSGNG